IRIRRHDRDVDPGGENSDSAVREILSSSSEEGVPPSGTTRLYCELRYGQGRVGILTINDQTHREAGANFLRELWKGIVGGRVHSTKSSFIDRAAMFRSPDMERLLNDESRDVGLTFITALIAAYLLLVGPGLYFILKRLNRLPAVIWAEPLLVVVYL